MLLHFRCLCPNFTTLCRWKQIIEKSLWTGPFNLHRFRSSQRWWHFSPLSRRGKMEQFCSIFAVWVKIWPPYTLCKWKQIIEKSFWTGSFNLPLVSELSTIVIFYRLKQAMENGAMLLHFRCLCPNFTTLCRWKQIIEKSWWTGPFYLHRFRSSQRWWHFSPLSRRGKMEQFCSFFAVWVKIWPPYTLCKWKQIIEKSFWTRPFNLP